LALVTTHVYVGAQAFGLRSVPGSATNATSPSRAPIIKKDAWFWERSHLACHWKYRTSQVRAGITRIWVLTRIDVLLT